MASQFLSTPIASTREYTLLRVGAVCLIVGSVAVFAFRGLHGDLPTDTGAAALRYVAASPLYHMVHLGANVGILLWTLGLVALASSFAQCVAWVIGRVGAASVVVGAAIYIVDFSIDGYALRQLSDVWAVAAPAAHAGLEVATLAVLVALGGVSLSSILILWGVAPVVYGVALVREGYPRWWGWTGTVVGAAVLTSALAQFYQSGFVLGLVVYAGLPLIAQLWTLALGIAMWRRAGTVAVAPAPPHR